SVAFNCILSLSIPGTSRRRWYLSPLSTVSTRGVLDNTLRSSSSVLYGLNIPNSLGKRQSIIEDQGFITSSMSRLKLSKILFNRMALCSCLPLSSTRLGTRALTSFLVLLVLDFLGLGMF